MTYRPERLCICGHKQSAHEHYRASSRPTDCALCGLDGPVACRMFTARGGRPFDEAQRRAGEEADIRMMRSLLALSSFAVSTRTGPLAAIPEQRRRWTVQDELELRRRRRLVAPVGEETS